MGDEQRSVRVSAIARVLGALIAGGLLFGLGKVSGSPSDWWGDWLRSPGFAGIAAVSAAVIAYVAATLTARSQRDQSEKDRAERVRSERKSQWWSRAQWALDLMKESDPAAREMGLRFLAALARSEWAGEHEGDIVAAASGEALDAKREPSSVVALRLLRTGATPAERRNGAEILTALLQSGVVADELGPDEAVAAASAIATWFASEGDQSNVSSEQPSE
ncbi:hypothetical protein ACFQRL_01525 [Microbacterium fluvii]|uniref:HEAT repeat domain-containing protein n=1 Tax=Microbacterium fluvii TaxID=415215 RepID=A0ABW2HCN8_9MICO|nr:hypothetical protein [Microbacterium fluvii]MCU4671268.1 hypothetical protein [Microbacterium fluvii]